MPYPNQYMPYQPGYMPQPYQPQPYQPPQPQPIYGVNRVSGSAGADAFPMRPNTVAALFDDDDDVLGAVSDRLVGGVMFHSEHADLCRWMGLDKLAKLHEDGYQHDSLCLRKVHRLCIDHLGMTVPEGRQERSHLLDAYHGKRSWDVQPDARAVQDAMADWIEWESGTCDVLAGAYRRLHDGGELLLAKRVGHILLDTKLELAHARQLMHEMQSCGWDMSHVLEMKY